MIIREAHPTDAITIAKIQVSVWKQAYKTIFPNEFLQQLSYEDKKNSIQHWLKNLEENTKVFIAEVESKKNVGFAVGGLERENNPIYKGELWGIYVLKKYQNIDVGTKLVKKIITHLLNINITSMLVWVLKDNPYRNFYEKLKGKIIAEKQKVFNGLSREIISYGWRDIRKIF
ncbi:MAG: GNAT family N-acetyltransferase [Promethearchaeota archaeon]|nr:MAG: GNAT family N-acetyltransferase [Candidatus Lokiarchaeota archaeon]